MDQEQSIRKLLNESKSIAVVGFSSKQERPGYYVPAYLQRAGYRIHPVNPYIEQALGETAYPDLKSIDDPVDVVEIFRRAEDVPAIVDEAIEIGAKGIWMQLGILKALHPEDAGLLDLGEIGRFL